MPEFLNIISIVCNISPHFVDSLGENETVQVVLRKHIQHLFNLSFIHINKTNRIAIATGYSAEISFTGPPEDAVFLATDVFNKISASNKHCSTTLTASIGIHLQSISMVDNLSAHPKTIQNGIKVAKQLMNLAKSNEILVSPSFYEAISPKDQSRTTLFEENKLLHDNQVINFQNYLKILKLVKAKENDVTDLTKQNYLQQKLHKSIKFNFFNLNQLKYLIANLFIGVLIFTSDEFFSVPLNEPIKLVKPIKIVESKQLVLNLTLQPVGASFLRVHFIEPELTQPNFLVETQNNALVKSILKSNFSIKAKHPRKIPIQETSNTVNANLNKPENEEIVISEAIKYKEIIVPKPIKTIDRPEQKMICSQAVIALNQCH